MTVQRLRRRFLPYLLCLGLFSIVVASAVGFVSGNATNRPIALGSGTGDCSSKVARRSFVAFIRAFNRGDSVRLDSIFAERPAFQWYGAGAPGQRSGLAARRRDTLIRYFRARHSRHDRMHLVQFQFNGNSGWYGNFEFSLRRSAVGFRHRDWFRASGKGALICSGQRGRFIVISLSGPTDSYR